MEAGYGPHFVVPEVSDLICWFKVSFVRSMSTGEASDPVVFFQDLGGGNCGASFKQEIFKVQGAGSDLSKLRQGVAQLYVSS